MYEPVGDDVLVFRILSTLLSCYKRASVLDAINAWNTRENPLECIITTGISTIAQPEPKTFEICVLFPLSNEPQTQENEARQLVISMAEAVCKSLDVGYFYLIEGGRAKLYES